MMLQSRNDHFVAFAKESPAIRRCYEVDGLSNSPNEYDFLRRFRIDESPGSLTGFFISLRRTLRQRMNAPVNVGIGGLIIVYERLDHLAGFLRRRRIIEVHQVPAIHLL